MLTELQKIAREAGALILSAHDAKVYVKPGDANFVTDYDLRVQELVRKRLAKLCPEAAFIGEESKENDYASRLCFIVDPIDGTTNFMHGYRRSCVSIALVEDGKPVLGAVCDPYMGELFSAEAGKGAFCNDTRLRASDFAPERAIIAIGTTPYNRAAADATFDAAKAVFLRFADIRRSGTAAIDMCCVAAGRLDGFFELSLSPWDIAAGSLMVTEAGGISSDFAGNPNQYARPASLLCASETIYPILKDILKETIK